MLRTVLSIIIIVIFAQCNSSKSTTESHIIDDLDGTYYISQLNKVDVIEHNLTIEFDPLTDNIAGYAGCNRYFGTYTQENEVLTTSKLASTKMYCQPEIKNKLENQLLKSISMIDSIGTNESGTYNLFGDSHIILQISKNK